MLTFNLPRVKALFIRELYLSYLPMLRVSSIVILLIYTINLIGRLANRNDGPYDDDFSATIIKFGLLLMIGGFLFASTAFKEFSVLSKRAEFLALPGSSLEKVSVKWLVTNPLFILTLSLLLALAATVFTPMIARFGGDVYANEIFFSKQYWNLVGIYFVVHSVFLFGSIAFNKYAAIKTIVVLLITFAAVVLINAIFFRIVFADMFDSLFEMKSFDGSRQFGVNYSDPSEMWQVQFFIFAFKYILAPVLWVASLFKLTEKEV